MRYFVTAIGTDSGKTVASAILCEALHADYWKPVQAGFPRDTDTVRSLVSNGKTIFHPESFLLNTASSPHAAAKKDNIVIDMRSIRMPDTRNTLIIEGAGGCLVPLNDRDLVIDLVPVLQADVVVVSNHYLGSINHTLLTLEALVKRKVVIKGLIFNGEVNEESEQIIMKHSKLKCLLRINKESMINPSVIKKYAATLNASWHE
jgi:dethiobiotin synthetase